jgi:hypothetical protein
MAIIEGRPIDEYLGEPLYGFCRKNAPVRTRWVAVPFRDFFSARGECSLYELRSS